MLDSLLRIHLLNGGFSCLIQILNEFLTILSPLLFSQVGQWTTHVSINDSSIEQVHVLAEFSGRTIFLWNEQRGEFEDFFTVWQSV